MTDAAFHALVVVLLIIIAAILGFRLKVARRLAERVEEVIKQARECQAATSQLRALVAAAAARFIQELDELGRRLGIACEHLAEVKRDRHRSADAIEAVQHAIEAVKRFVESHSVLLTALGLGQSALPVDRRATLVVPARAELPSP
jgi:hypothetical protein